MKKLINTINWTFTTVLFSMAVYAVSLKGYLGALLLFSAGIIISPIAISKKLRSKLKLNGILAVVISIVLLFAGVLLTPDSPIENKFTGTQKTVSSESSSVSKSTTDNNSLTTSSKQNTQTSSVGSGKAEPFNLANIPPYSGKAYTVVNNNIPNFSVSELKSVGYENYSNLDNLGRTQTALASVGKDTMPAPNEKRGSISKIKPTAWVQTPYNNIDGKYLYNRCHLIGWQLSAENANKRNLITGTKYLNVDGMLPFENMVADYIKETKNHVAYRITPIYDGNNLLASGVQMEAYSVEDNGAGICFNIYCYNVQPGITINYADGTSHKTSK